MTVREASASAPSVEAGRPLGGGAPKMALGGILAAVALVACAVTGIVMGSGGSFALVQGPAAALLEVGAALALLCAGVIALVRGRPFAAIVVALGGAWAVREWANPEAPGAVVFTLGLLLGTVWIPLAGWLAFAYPRRMPERRRERIVLILAFGATLLPSATRAATFDPASGGCIECPANLMLVTDAPAAAALALRTGAILALLAGLLILWCIADRFTRASPAERLLIGPVSATSAAAVGLTVAGLVIATLIGPTALAAVRALTAAVAVALIGVAVALTWEIVRVGTARRRSVRLVSDLGAAPAPGRLRDELAAIMHDDTLELAFPLADRVVDARGQTTPDPRAGGEERMRHTTVAVGPEGSALALLTHRPGLLDDDEFRDAVARAAGLAIEHERLQAELVSRVSDLRESRERLVASFDAERRRLERDLHDGAQQQLVALLLELRLARARHPHPALEEAITEVTSGLDELRNLAHGLYPAALAEDGLAAAFEQLREGAEIPVRLVAIDGRRWPAAIETTAYTVVAETLRGRGVRSADVEVSAGEDILRVTVSGARDGSGGSEPFGHDIAGLADRVGAVGGAFHVDETPASVTVRAELPCGS